MPDTTISGLKSELTLTEDQLKTAIEMYLETHNLTSNKITFGVNRVFGDMRGDLTPVKYYAKVEFFAGKTRTTYSTRPTTPIMPRTNLSDDH